MDAMQAPWETPRHGGFEPSQGVSALWGEEGEEEEHCERKEVLTCSMTIRCTYPSIRVLIPVSSRYFLVLPSCRVRLDTMMRHAGSGSAAAPQANGLAPWIYGNRQY